MMQEGTVQVCAGCAIAAGLEKSAEAAEGGPQVPVIRGQGVCSVCHETKWACRIYPVSTLEPKAAQA